MLWVTRTKRGRFVRRSSCRGRFSLSVLRALSKSSFRFLEDLPEALQFLLVQGAAPAIVAARLVHGFFAPAMPGKKRRKLLDQ